MKRALFILLLGLAAGAGAYLASIRAQEPYDPNSLDSRLAWMKFELGLSDAQFARIRELHQASGPRLRELSVRLDQLENQLAAFEQSRHTADRVDFVAFERYDEVRRRVDRECLESASRLISDSAVLMTPRQRERYLEIVGVMAPDLRHSPN